MSYSFKSESGKAALVALAVVIIAALGGIVYFASQATEKKGDTVAALEQQQAMAAAQVPAAGTDAKPGEATVIKPGDPVVAKVDGAEVKRSDVVNLIQSLPPETRALPIDKIYPPALEQVINARLISEKTKGVSVDNDPEFKKQMQMARAQITSTVYLQNQVNAKVSEDRLKDVYAQYVKAFPDINDVKASHILVKDQAKAKELIKQLDGGADFAALAKENSIDATAANGGSLGYFAKTDVVAEFGDAAFALAPGTYTKKPVKTQFGYHVIKSEEARKRPPASFDEVKPFLEVQVRRQILDEMIQDWRKDANIERFDINGENKIEPSSGAETPAAPVTPPAQ